MDIAEPGALAGQVGALEQEEAGLRSRGTVAHVMQERGEGPSAFVLFRGDYDKRRDEIVIEIARVSRKMRAEQAGRS